MGTTLSRQKRPLEDLHWEDALLGEKPTLGAGGDLSQHEAGGQPPARVVLEAAGAPPPPTPGGGFQPSDQLGASQQPFFHSGALLRLEV